MNKMPLIALAIATLWVSPVRAETYTCTDHSEVRFTAYAPIRTDGVGGESHTVKGKIEIPDGNLAAISAGFSVPVTTFASKAGLDQHTLEAVEAAKYPAVMFRSKTVTIESRGDAPDGLHLAGTIEGMLNFHGVKRPMTCHFTALKGTAESSLDTDFTVSLTEYGIERPKIMFIQVDDPVKIHVHLVAVKQP